MNFKHLLTHPLYWMAVIFVLGPVRGHKVCILNVFTEVPQYPWSSHHWAAHHENINHRLWAEYLMVSKSSSGACAGIKKSKGHHVCKHHTRKTHTALSFIRMHKWHFPLGHNCYKPQTTGSIDHPSECKLWSKWSRHATANCRTCLPVPSLSH